MQKLQSTDTKITKLDEDQGLDLCSLNPIAAVIRSILVGKLYTKFKRHDSGKEHPLLHTITGRWLEFQPLFSNSFDLVLD